MVGGCLKVGANPSPKALVSQLAEETDSKPVQCGFESHRGHQITAAKKLYCPPGALRVEPDRTRFVRAIRQPSPVRFRFMLDISVPVPGLRFRDAVPVGARQQFR